MVMEVQLNACHVIYTGLGMIAVLVNSVVECETGTFRVQEGVQSQ